MTSGEDANTKFQERVAIKNHFSSPVSTDNTWGCLIMMKLLQTAISFSVSRVILQFLRNKLRLKELLFLFRFAMG